MKGKLTISATSGNSGRWMEIRLYDDASREEFVTIKVDHKALMECLTGFGHQEVDFSVNNLDTVGQKKIVKPLRFIVPKTLERLNYRYSDKDYAMENAQSFCDEGWTADLYFGSQTSFMNDVNGHTWAISHQYRYEEEV